MKKTLFPFIVSTLLFYSPLTSQAGSWYRENNKTLRFSGRFTKGDAQQLKQLLKPQDSKVIINSVGGLADEALRSGEMLIKQKSMEIVVVGACLSSCANYIFTVGKTKTLQNAFVGFHGNVTAYLKFEWPLVKGQLQKENNLTDLEMEIIKRENEKLALREKKFFEDLGISQDLFDRTQLDDKGFHDGKVYTFLLPKPLTFEKYGIFGVVGEQNFHLGELMGLQNILD